MEIWQITTTLPSESDAQTLASRLVTDRLAACIQIDGPIRSIYWWQDALANELEWRCTVKTEKQCVEKCIERLRENHPYKVPEILAAPVPVVDAEYAAWIENQVRNT